MKKLSKQTFVSVLCSALLLASPAAAVAEPEIPSDEQALPVVLIAEVQTGNAARADEFIELYNATDEPLDLTGWQLRYITASATSVKNVEDPSTVISLAPPLVGEDVVLVPAGGTYVLYSGVVGLPEGVVGQQYEGMLPATGGSLVLVRPDDATCEFVVEDALAWGATVHLFGEGEALVAGSASSADRLFQRFVGAGGAYADTGANAQDFFAASAAVATPSTGSVNTISLPDVLAVGSGMASQTSPVRFANSGCTPPEEPEQPVEPTEPTEEPTDPGEPTLPPEESPPSVSEPPAEEAEGPEEPEAKPQPVVPAANSGLKAPLVSELLPNPASPQTDKDDEFIELYNPNDAAFDLSGYVLEVGLTSKRRFTIPAGTKLPPRAFLAFFSSDSGLALSNTGSQVVLVDPRGQSLAIAEAYATAKDGQAWVLAEGKWQWTTKPSPNAVNVVSVPVVKSATTKKSKTTTTKKTTGTTNRTTPATGTDKQEDVQASAPVAATTGTPLHPGILAAVGLSALLYGAYEYRHDMANRFYQFRTNRAARRARRQSAKGR